MDELQRAQLDERLTALRHEGDRLRAERLARERETTQAGPAVAGGRAAHSPARVRLGHWLIDMGFADAGTSRENRRRGGARTRRGKSPNDSCRGEIDRDRRLPRGPGRSLFSGRSALSGLRGCSYTRRHDPRFPPRPRPVVSLLAVVSFIVALAAPAAVLGHAELDTMTPANTRRDAAPTEIVATFRSGSTPPRARSSSWIRAAPRSRPAARSTRPTPRR